MGIVWALAAAIMAAFTGVLAARPLRRMGLMSATLLTNVFNMLVLALIGWWEYDPDDVTLEGMLWFALLGVTAYSYGRLVYYKAIDSIGPPRLMTLMSASPLLSLSLAVLFLGEQPGLAVLGGTGLVVAGVILVSYEPARGRWFQPGILWGFASAISLGVSVFIRKKGPGRHAEHRSHGGVVEHGEHPHHLQFEIHFSAQIVRLGGRAGRWRPSSWSAC